MFEGLKVFWFHLIYTVKILELLISIFYRRDRKCSLLDCDKTEETER